MILSPTNLFLKLKFDQCALPFNMAAGVIWGGEALVSGARS